MSNFQLIIAVVMGWFLVGYLIALIRVKLWFYILIKKEKAIKEPEIKKWNFGAGFLMSIVWPFQCLQSYLEDWKTSNQEKAMPILPISFEPIRARSNINHAIINNNSEYYYSYTCPNENIDRDKYIKSTFGIITLLGGINIISWALGLFALLFVLFVSFIFWLGGLISELFGKYFTPGKVLQSK